MDTSGRPSQGESRTLPMVRGRNSRDREHPATNKAERRSSRTRRRRTRTPRTPPDLPGLDLTEEGFLKEWGITKDQEEAKLAEFRKILEAELGPLKPVFDRYFLRRFLRARQHDLLRAADMFKAHLKWREEFGTESIIDDFHFHERDAFLSLYPQGYHKTDRLGRPIYIQHLGQINVRALSEVTNVERMLRFHVQEYERAMRYIFPACSLIAGRHIGQTLAIMDLKGVGLRHLTGEVKNILSAFTRNDQDNYPETLGKTLIINAPAVFRAIWTIVKPMLDPRTQAKIEVCPNDYMKVLTRWVDPANIPQYLGGKSQGALIDDVGPWNDPALVAEIDARRASVAGLAGESPVAHDEGRAASPFLTTTPVGLAGRQSRGTMSFEPLIGGVAVGSDVEVSISESGEMYHDALARRVSSASSTFTSAYLSADEGDFVSSSEGPQTEGGRAGARLTVTVPEETGEGEGVMEASQGKRYAVNKQTLSSPPMQISILARVRALEEQVSTVERGVRGHLPPREELPSHTVGQGTLLGRVEALEKATDILLRAQQAAMMSKPKSRSRCKCCAGCTVM